MIANTESAILERLIEPGANGLPVELARYFLTLTFKPYDQQRMAELAEKAQAGSLTADEQTEIDTYVSLSHLLALLKSKARLAIANSQG